MKKNTKNNKHTNDKKNNQQLGNFFEGITYLLIIFAMPLWFYTASVVENKQKISLNQAQIENSRYNYQQAGMVPRSISFTVRNQD